MNVSVYSYIYKSTTSWSKEVPKASENFNVLFQTEGDHKRSNPLRWNKESRSAFTGTLITEDRYARSTYEGSRGYYPSRRPHLPNQSLKDAVYNTALSRFNSQVRDSDLNLAVAIAEAPETVKLFRSAVTSARQLRRLARWAVRNPREVLSSSWLTWAYAIRPTMSDVYNAATFRLDKRETFRARGRATLTEDVSEEIPSQYESYSGTVSVRHEIGATLRQSSQFNANLARLTSLNPALIAWELVPLSFVVDWFFNVGGYLSNLEVALGSGWEWIDGWETSTILSEEMVEKDYTKKSSFYRKSSLQASQSFKSLDRQVLSDHPLPRLPTVDLDLGSSQMISAAALFDRLVLDRILKRR